MKEVNYGIFVDVFFFCLDLGYILFLDRDIFVEFRRIVLGKYY